MLVIRLRRTGKKNQPSFRVVVTDKLRAAGKGVPVEEVGFYNPLTKERSLKKERILHWLSVGAQPSDTVRNMLISEKVIEGSKAPKHGTSKKPVEEAKPAEAKTETKPVEETKEKEGEAVESEKKQESEELKPEEAKEALAPEPKQEAKEESAPSNQEGEAKEA